MDFKCSQCSCCCFFNLIEENYKKEFDANKKIFNISKGETFIREGDIVDGFYILQQGYAKVMMKGYFKDKQHIIRLCKSGDIIGHRSLNSYYYHISAKALSDSVVCFFDRDFFMQLLKNNSKLSYSLLLFLVKELYESEMKSRNYVMMSVKELVAASVLYIDKKFGKEKDAPALSRQDIAEIASTTKEQVSLYLKELEAEGLIKFENKKIIIKDRLKLESLVEKYREHYEPIELVLM
ncbi:MAG: transcriptional regulator [Bacteroidia bacterium]|nr:MAG: transcriptional regulator [Bacteroidia bacterium]